jgi:DNA repair protein RadC
VKLGDLSARELRERLADNALVLRTGVRGQPVEQLASRLLREFGGQIVPDSIRPRAL